MTPIRILLCLSMFLMPSVALHATENGTTAQCATAPRILRNPNLISAQTLHDVDILEIRANDERNSPAKGRHYTPEEIALVVDYVKNGGALFVVIDESLRTPLHEDGLAALVAPFGIGFTPDTEYHHNCGAIAKAGVINKQDREIPYSGGRAVTGGTPFAWQLDLDGNPAQPTGAYLETQGGGRIVAMADAMAYIGLGTAEGIRLSGVPHDASRTTYWGKDSAIFMEEVRCWLMHKPDAQP